MNINKIDENQLRQSIELDDLYESWLASARFNHRGRLRWKHRSGQDYLCLLRPGSDTGRGMGARSPETEALYQEGRENEAREEETWKRLLIKGRLFKAARLPTVPEAVAKVLRELDTAQLLDKHLRVIGSTALPAYELEAGVRFPAELLATEDFDLSWVANAPTQHPPHSLNAALKSADATWTVVQDRGFQLRNRAGYIIDVVMASELIEGYPRSEPVRPLPTEGQEWLLGGAPVSHVVVDSLGKPARIVAPDPRLFALHKLFIAQLPSRGRKQEKDRNQALTLLDTIQHHMPHYPLDEEFSQSLPKELFPLLAKWQDRNALPSNASRKSMK